MTPGFGRRAAIAVLVALGLALVVQVATADGPDAISGGLGGDYPAFHAVGVIVREEPGLSSERFQDPEVRFAAQEPFLPSDEEGQLYFGYPPFFAAPYAVLSLLDYEWSYLVHTLLMAAAVAAAVVVLRPVSPTLDAHPVEAYVVALTFFPLFRAVTGGQNTALSLLLAALVWRSLHDRREARAGVAAALLLFKPPLGLPFVAGLVLARRWRAVAAALVTSVFLWLVAAAMTDVSWVEAWLDGVRYLDHVDTPFNVHNFVSVPGAAEALFGIDSAGAAIVGYGIAAVAALLVAWVWWRDLGTVGSRVVTMAAAAVLISPHALYYDAGLLLLVGLLMLDDRPTWRPAVVVAWAFGLTQLFADHLDVSPLVLLVVAGYLVALRITWSRRGSNVPVPSRSMAAS